MALSIIAGHSPAAGLAPASSGLAAAGSAAGVAAGSAGLAPASSGLAAAGSAAGSAAGLAPASSGLAAAAGSEVARKTGNRSQQEGVPGVQHIKLVLLCRASAKEMHGAKCICRTSTALLLCDKVRSWPAHSCPGKI
jgi:hypothetical protein